MHDWQIAAALFIKNRTIQKQEKKLTKPFLSGDFVVKSFENMHSGCLWEDRFPYSGEGSVFPAAGKAPFSPRCKERRGKYGKIPFPVKGTAIVFDAVKNGRHGLSLFCELLYKQMPIYPMWTRHLM